MGNHKKELEIMYKSLIAALAMIVATPEAVELTSQTQGPWSTESYLREGESLHAGESIQSANTLNGGSFTQLKLTHDCKLKLTNYTKNNSNVLWQPTYNQNN